MNFTVIYYNKSILDEIESWPVDFLADYARILELLLEFGGELRLPHSRAMGKSLFELRPRGKSGIARVFYCFVVNKKIFIIPTFIKDALKNPKSCVVASGLMLNAQEVRLRLNPHSALTFEFLSGPFKLVKNFNLIRKSNFLVCTYR